MNIRKTKSKIGERYHFSGIIEDVYEYTNKEGKDILVLVCRDKEDASRQTPDRDILFSNYKQKFDEMNSGIEQIQPGDDIEVDYFIFTNENTGKNYFNFIDVKFPQ